MQSTGINAGALGVLIRVNLRFSILSNSRLELKIDRPDGTTFALDTAKTTAPSSTSSIQIGASTTTLVVGSASVVFTSGEWAYSQVGLMDGASGSAVFDTAGTYPIRLTYYDSASAAAIGGIKLRSDANTSGGELVALSVGP